MNDASDLDFFTPEAMADPAFVIEQLYAGPRCRYYDRFDPPFHILSRYEDVSHVLMNPTRFLSGHGQGPNFVPASGIVSDAPMHTFYRRLGQGYFKPGSIAALRPRLEAIAENLLDAVEDKDVWDIHDDLSFPLPVTAICEIFGIPTEDIWQFKLWSDASVALLSAQDPSPYVAEVTRMHDYLTDLLHRKRDEGDDGTLLARVAEARRDGALLTDEEAIGFVTQLFVAGNETTTSLITNFMMRMLGPGYQWADFCAGKIDMAKAINESLRYDPPLLAMFRTAKEDEVIDGVTVPAGTKVMIHYAAANRDPAVFENPNVFDVNRPVRKHVSFALGLHFCLGAELARLEATVTLEALARRHPNLRMIDEGERIGPFLFWGRKKLPVTSKAA